MPVYCAPDGSTFTAADVVDGIPIDPELPPNFDDTDNRRRPRAHWMWWRQPFIVTHEGGCTVRCLDGGAWDRSTWWATCRDVAEGVRVAKAHPMRSYFTILLESLPRSV